MATGRKLFRGIVIGVVSATIAVSAYLFIAGRSLYRDYSQLDPNDRSNYPNLSASDYDMARKGALVQGDDLQEHLALNNTAQGIENKRAGDTSRDDWNDLLVFLSSKNAKTRGEVVGALTHFSGDLREPARAKLREMAQTDPDMNVKVLAVICLSHCDSSGAQKIAKADLGLFNGLISQLKPQDPETEDKKKLLRSQEEICRKIVAGQDLRTR